MKLSARNTIEGKIVSLKKGPVSTEVVIETPCGQQIAASITTTSAENLNLKEGEKAFAIIKASEVIVAVE